MRIHSVYHTMAVLTHNNPLPKRPRVYFSPLTSVCCPVTEVEEFTEEDVARELNLKQRFSVTDDASLFACLV